MYLVPFSLVLLEQCDLSRTTRSYSICFWFLPLVVEAVETIWRTFGARSRRSAEFVMDAFDFGRTLSLTCLFRLLDHNRPIRCLEHCLFQRFDPTSFAIIGIVGQQDLYVRMLCWRGCFLC